MERINKEVKVVYVLNFVHKLKETNTTMHGSHMVARSNIL